MKTPNLRLTALALLLSTSLLPAVAHATADEADAAADAAADDQGRESIVVTGLREKATQQAAEAITFGNNVQIVDRAAIEATGATNFAEIAQFLIKGANVGYSPDEGEYTIRLDGGGDRDTLVVLDGVPLYDRGPALEDIWGTTTIDPHMIERAEVYRGGNSLFFGSNGGIGVISLVTKRPDGTDRVELGAQYGEFNTREIWGNARFAIDADKRHSFMVYGSSIQTDGPRIFRPQDIIDNVAASGGIQKYPLNRGNVGVKYLFQPDEKTQFRVNAQYTQIEFQDPFPDTETFSPNRVRYPIVDFTFERRWSDKLFTELAGYWSNPKLNNTETFPEICMIRTGCVDPTNAARTVQFGFSTGRSVPFPNKGFGEASKVGGFREMGLNFRNTINLPNALEVVAGVQVVSYKDDSDPVFRIGSESQTVTGLYADFRPVIPFSSDTKLSLAIRTDFSESFGSKTIWKFGFRQPIGDFYLRGNGGTSYSLPRTNELFRQEPTIIGNPDLKTEQTKTFNFAAGFAKDFGGLYFDAEFGWFKTDITNRIQATSGLTPNTYFNNTAVTQIRGLAADVNLRISETLSANVNFTKQQARLAGSSLQINETPEYMIGGNVAWHSPDKTFHVTLFPRYQGPEYSTGGLNNSLRYNFGNYFVMNASIGLWLGEDRQHKFQLRVANVFDKVYAERYGFGNRRYDSRFIRGEIALNSPQYFYGYPFEGKPRAFYVSYNTSF
ncbi:MAG: TonB-dependent receptor [Novosphingobium sp.]|nr:MAG: TonB-dependent receptor [Novosphingobium sp.]